MAQDRIVQAIEAGKVSALPGTVHPLARAEYDQGPVAATMQLHGMTMTFKPSAAQQASLDALLKAQQTPSSSSYHQWLTQAQFADQFGMSQGDLDKVTQWLQSQGFTVDKVADSRNAIRFSGSVTLAEQAFHTQIHKYVVNGESYFANATEVSLPSAFAGTVSHIGGLADFKPKPRYVRPATKQGTHPQYTDGVAGGHYIAPGDFAVIYDVNPLYTAGSTGTGQTIGIMGQTDIVMADIASFRSAAGLPVNNPTVFLIPGSADPGIGDASGDINEADLDLEWSGGVAKNASIVFVNSNNVFDSLQYAIANKINGVQIPILSISYGACEPSIASAELAGLEASFQQANAQGQTVIAAAGDNGAADCDAQSNPNAAPITSATQGLQVDYPGSSAYVTSMGGSEFTGDGTAQNPSTGADQYWSANGSTSVLTSAKSYIPEMAWNDTTFEIENGGGLTAGGGGKSLLFPKPSWQTGVPGIPTDSARDVPDASLSASADHDPYLVCTQIILASDPTQSNFTSSCINGFYISDQGNSDDKTLTAFGGTSVAAPSFAGALALIEQKLGVPQGLGNVNPALYTLASNASTYASAFHDITTGNNIVPCTAGSPNCPNIGTMGYPAGTGYDQATGLGSVDVSNLATAFGTIATKLGTTTTIAASPASPLVGATVTITATVAPSSGTTAPTGTVTFTIDGTAGTAVALTNGMAVMTTSFSTGGAHTVVASYSGDTNFYVSTSAVTTITVVATGAATTTTLAATPATLALYGSLTLTATVQSTTGGTVAGTVTFTIGTTTVGTQPVTAGASGTGTATLAVSSATPALGFTAGTDTIVAAYGGDSSYAGSSGNATVTVTNPDITVSAANVTISSPSPGNSGTSTVTVTSTGGYTGTVNLTATTTANIGGGLGNASVAVSTTTPGTTTLTIQTVAATGSERKAPGGNLRKMVTKVAAAGGTAAGCILLLLIPGIRRRRWPAALVMLVFLGVSAGLGCGSGGGGGGAPAGTYTVTITATDSSNANITATGTCTVIIQ